MEGVIGFDMVYPDSAEGEYGSKEDPAPYVCLHDPSHNLKYMTDPAEIVISKPQIKLAFRHRLEAEHVFSLTAPKGKEGFSRAALAFNIARIYQSMFQEEGQTPAQRNRAVEEGLSDLVLEGVWFDAAKDVYRLRVCS